MGLRPPPLLLRPCGCKKRSKAHLALGGGGAHGLRGREAGQAGKRREQRAVGRRTAGDDDGESRTPPHLHLCREGPRIRRGGVEGWGVGGKAAELAGRAGAARATGLLFCVRENLAGRGDVGGQRLGGERLVAGCATMAG